MRVAFLVGSDNESTRQSMEAVCRLAGVQPVGILLDTAVAPLSRRVRNLLRNIRVNGYAYPFTRFLGAIRDITDGAVERAASSPAETLRVLRSAFPERCFSLHDLAAKYGMPVHAVGNLNSAHAATMLRECNADLGIVLGTRILKSGTFSVPRLGCINLHKGKVPEYRGMPPGFWELFDGADSAGITVHFVDKGLDTGDIVATATVPIRSTETPDSLLEKLHQEGARLIASAVAAIRDGTVIRQTQDRVEIKARTKPTQEEVALLRRRLPHWKHRGHVSAILRNLYLLLVYYSGLYSLVRAYHGLRGGSRGAIFLYHRVNDYSKDVLTVDTWAFATQLLAFSKRYPIIPTHDLVDRLRNHKPISPTTLAIHFDDCYRDILTNGAPILKTLGLPACAFINSGFIDTERQFDHDLAAYPFVYENFRSDELRQWSKLGLEVGAHTVNHVDLGRHALDSAHSEVAECGKALEKLLAQRIDLFSFPFGRVDNISPAARQAISASGYSALFSAHGGFIHSQTDLFDIPRMGSSGESPTVYCLLQVEGLALSQVAETLRAWMGLRKPASAAPVVRAS